jgi:hypothetical protein
LKTTTRGFGVTDVTDLVANPPALVGPTGVRPGASLQFTLSGSGETARVKIDFVRLEQVDIGRQSVESLLTHQVATLSGKLNGTQTTDSWVVPTNGQSIKDHTIVDGTAFGASVKSDVTSTLEALTPT